MTDHHVADLNHGLKVGVVLEVLHDLIRVRAEPGLERLDRVTEDVAHADVGWRSVRRPAGARVAEVSRYLLTELYERDFNRAWTSMPR